MDIGSVTIGKLCTVMVDEIVFLLVPNVPTSANWPAGKGAQIGGRGWDQGLGLGLAGQRGITSSFPSICGWTGGRTFFINFWWIGGFFIFTLFLFGWNSI